MSQLQPSRIATYAYVAPFVAFVGIMAIEKALSVPPQIAYPIRFCIVWALVIALSRPYLKLQFSAPLASIAVGAVVFVIWVGPDLLFDYRQHWLFNNSVVGTAVSSISPELRRTTWFVLIRTISCTLLVPIVEELFWRGWMMRWMIDREFDKVPLGKYDATAFWVTAVLFASEHGPYWEVGLITGVIYNWWMLRTKSLADCILMHAVTNGILCVYVLKFDRWEYLF